MTKLILLMCLFSAGCSKTPMSTTATKNPNFQVELLFEHEGCKVYRFEDYRTRYFTNCKGSVEWNESCGKNCNRDVEVTGGR